MTGRRSRKPDKPLLAHATCVAIGKRGVLILGPPGAGKSDLALRLMDQPGRGTGLSTVTAVLVSDDQVEIRRAGKKLVARAPANIAGKLEVRGVGIVKVPYRKEVALLLAVVLTDQKNIERLPEDGALVHEVLGIKLPVVAIDPKLASAPARLRAALAQL